MAVRPKWRTRADGSKYRVWEARWKDPKTKTWPAKTFLLKKDADEYYEEKRELVRAGKFIRARDTVTFSTAFAEYDKGPPGLNPGERNPYGLDLETRMRTGVPGIDTVKIYRSHARRFVLPEFGNTLLSEIDTADVNRYVYHLCARYKWSYVKHTVNVIREVLQYAVERRPQWLPRNPLREEPIKPPPHAKMRTVRGPTVEQVRQLIFAVAAGPQIGDHLETFYLAAAQVALGLLGMRVGEKAGLNCEDIDFRAGVLHVRHNFTRSGVLKRPKGDRERDLPLPDGVRHVLWDAWTRMGQPDRGPFLRDSDGLRVGQHKLSSHIFPWIMRRAGLVDLTRPPNKAGRHRGLFTDHSLRRFVASYAKRQKVAMGEIQSILGHADERTTKLYLFLQAEISHGATVLDEMGNLVGIEHVARTRAPALELLPPPEIIPPSLPQPRPRVRNGVVIGVRHSREKVLEVAVDRHVNGKLPPRAIAREIGGISEGTVKKLLIKAGVYDPRVWLDSPERVAKRECLVRLYNLGTPVEEIRKQEHVDLPRLYRILRAAGVQLRGHGRRMDDEAERAAAAVQMHRRGVKVPEIARANRVNNGRVYRWLREAGIKLRRPAPPPPRKIGRARTEHDPAVVSRAVERYRNGDRLNEVSREAGVSHTTLYQWLDEAGVPRRGRGRSKVREPRAPSPVNLIKERALHLGRKKVPFEEIAARCKPYSPATVYDWLLDAGLIQKVA